MNHYKSEVDLAADIIQWLKMKGWECYMEVCVSDGPCDIIATKTEVYTDSHLTACQVVWCIECKLHPSWHLFAQARRHVAYANKVSIAIPHSKMPWEDKQFLLDVLDMAKMGMLQARPGHVTENDAPFNAVANTRPYLDALKPEHKSYALAGSNRGYFTPFKGVASAVATYVKDHPGANLKELCEIPEVKAYYKKPSQAKANLRQWLARRVIKHVRAECEMGKTRYYPYDPASEPRI